MTPPASLRALLTSTAMSLLIVGCNEMAFRLPDSAVRFVAFGDSTTQGPARHDYADVLPGLLNEPASAFAKEGKGGETAQDGVARLRSLWSLNLYPDANVLLYWEGAGGLIDFVQNHDPLVVLSPDDPSYPFSAALNQELQDIQNAIESAIQIGQQGGLQVFVANYYSLKGDNLECDPLLFNVLLPQQEVIANQYLRRLNERIDLAASNQGAILVDIAAQDATLQADTANYFNCNHLSAAGNDIVAGIFAQTIRDHRPAQ